MRDNITFFFFSCFLFHVYFVLKSIQIHTKHTLTIKGRQKPHICFVICIQFLTGESHVICMKILKKMLQNKMEIRKYKMFKTTKYPIVFDLI